MRQFRIGNCTVAFHNWKIIFRTHHHLASGGAEYRLIGVGPGKTFHLSMTAKDTIHGMTLILETRHFHIFRYITDETIIYCMTNPEPIRAHHPYPVDPERIIGMIDPDGDMAIDIIQLVAMFYREFLG